MRIRKFDAAPATRDEHTDAGGNFQVAELPPGDYQLEISKASYVPAKLHFRLSGLVLGPIVIPLMRGGVVAGRVVDFEGRPVRGAKVLAVARPGTEGYQVVGEEGAREISSRVDDRGKYRLYGLPRGQYTLAVIYNSTEVLPPTELNSYPAHLAGSGILFYPNNSAPQPITISGKDESQNVDFMVLPSDVCRTVSGKVDGPRLAFPFWVGLVSEHLTSQPVAGVQTDAEGKFRFDNVPSGSYSLLASGPVLGRLSRGAMLGYQPLFGKTHLKVGGQAIDDVTIAVDRSRTAKIAIREIRSPDSGARCSQNARIELTSMDHWSVNTDHRSLDVMLEKEYTISGLTPGPYRVAAAPLDDEACYQAAAVVLDETVMAGSDVLTVPFARAGSIRGQVTGLEDVRPFAIILLATNELGREDLPHLAVPDADGRFFFVGIRPGHYRVSARQAFKEGDFWSNEPKEPITVEVAGGATTEIRVVFPSQ